ncbi:unnamed protein product [Somion occarium]|uniref:Fungal N-terminal domain-containing protein n=1 Tax=Somion occarium TaxID=3059160 RepID=A0ABP1DXA4_9APHY
MASAYDILGAVLGVLGTIGTIQLIYSLVHFNLPSQRLKDLDDTLNGTIHFLYTAIEDGLLPDVVFVQTTQRRLSLYRNLTERLRTRVHCATNFRQQCSAMANGLSSRINSLCGRVKAIRADISSVSENTRRLLEGENHCNDDNSSIGTIQQSSVAITTFGKSGIHPPLTGRLQILEDEPVPGIHIAPPPPVYTRSVRQHCHSPPANHTVLNLAPAALNAAFMDSYFHTPNDTDRLLDLPITTRSIDRGQLDSDKFEPTKQDTETSLPSVISEVDLDRISNVLATALTAVRELQELKQRHESMSETTMTVHLNAVKW